MSDEKKCGCKGIRTCLLCEQRSDVSIDQRENKEVRYIYTYCPHCNLCWPDNEETASLRDFPLYLGKLKLHLDFFSEEEETATVTYVDKIPWMPSQSGRRKQDFGPKVNFKKKKVKIGEFKGFPRFTECILRKFQNVPELSDFQPVELCNLEYSPERGSSIDPHIDDFWLWGERLVTINLGSSTVLTLVPCSENVCQCFQEANSDQFEPCTSFNGNIDRKLSCRHKFQATNTIKAMSINDTTFSKNSMTNGFDHGAENSNNDTLVPTASEQLQKENMSEAIPYSSNQLSHRTSEVPIVFNSSLLSPECSTKIPDIYVNENVKMSCHVCEQDENSSVVRKTPPKMCMEDIHSISCNKNIGTMCNVFRKDVNDLKASVRIVLPPRSLLVLAGCARYNWFHEIKREDVVSRRLAMTFRELTAEFLDGGKENQLGKALSIIANNFYDS